MNLQRALCAAILTTALATTTNAGDPATAVVTIRDVQTVPGHTALVGVTIEVDDLIGSFDLTATAGNLVISDVIYDGALFSNGWGGWDTTPALMPNISAACTFPQDQVIGYQHLFTLAVDVPVDARVGEVFPVDLTSAFVTNYSFQNFNVEIIAGSVTVGTTCDADFADGDGNVAIAELLALLNAWGSADPLADLNTDGTVNVLDLLALLAAWGPCQG